MAAGTTDAGGMFIKVDPTVIAQALDTHIRLAMVEALGKDVDGLIRAIVDSALAEEAPQSGYGKRESLFRRAINEMIRVEASKAFAEFLEGKRPVIHAAITAKIRSNADGMIDGFTDKFVEALTGGLVVDIRLKGMDGERY